MSDQVDQNSLEIDEDELTPVEKAAELYAVLGPLAKERREAQKARNAAIRDKGYLTPEEAERWHDVKTRYAEFRTARRLQAAAEGTEDPFAAKAEPAVVGSGGSAAHGDAQADVRDEGDD